MRAKFISVSIAVFILSGLCWTGCAHEGAYVAKKHSEYEIAWNNVGFLDTSLKNKIAVENVDSRRTATNTLEVFTVLRNRKDKTYHITARTNYFDSNKRPLETTRWEAMVLSPRGVADYTALSTRTDVGFYYIEVREGR